MVRGNRKERIFHDDVDRRRFLKIVAAALEKFGAECYVQCLMDNHVHKVIHTPRANISEVMQHIDGLYTQYSNWRHHTTGHVLEGRYTGIVIDDTCYLRNAIAYVLRNPVEAGLVGDAGDWPWSSYRAAMGNGLAPVRNNDLASVAVSRQIPSMSHDGYSMSMSGKNGRTIRTWHARQPKAQHEFKRRVRRVVGATLYRAALPRSYRAMARPPLAEVFAGVKRAERRHTIMRAHVVHGYLLTEIAYHLELHPTTISRIVNQTGSYRLTRE